ncbi:MAG: hypothetical protein M3270_05350 [Thermoproteota archaeon]|nr:hypothetical protein [Thermoproteota archaeon]
MPEQSSNVARLVHQVGRQEINQKQVGLEDQNCEYCSQTKAEIFQVTGDYCLQCWQDETHPNV